jgi:dihydroorotase
MDLLITGGRVIDPAANVDEVRDVAVRDGVFCDPAELSKDGRTVEVIDATGKVVAPGLIDLHVHFREPGQAAKETIRTGSLCAAAGGFTTVVCMPNTSPTADSPSTIQWIKDKATETAVIRVLPTGAITKGLAGEELAPIGSMKNVGIVAITDDGRCVQNHGVMRRAVEYARMFDLAVMDHCQDYSLVGDGVMNEGYWSHTLGLPGWPAAGEELIVQRNIVLAELCRTRIHCQHMSAAGSVRAIREARKRGVQISGEVCPHHIALTDESLKTFDSNFKMNPPLRTQADIDALIEGIADGTITILASDHAPHSYYEKEVEIDRAPFGILGLETEFPLFYKILVKEQKAIDLPRLIEMLTVEPAALLRLDLGTLQIGRPGDVTILDLETPWTYRVDESKSLSRNSPFDEWEFPGRAVRTILGGKTVWAA